MSMYNKNTEILKLFFKKPLTLVISILFFASLVSPCIYIIKQSVASSEFGVLYACAFPLLMILPAAAFFNLYIQGRKRSEIRQINISLILIYMYAILSVFLPTAFLAYSMLISHLQSNEFSFAFLGIFLLIFVVPAIIILSLQFVSMIIVFHSIRKSAYGIYLSKKGSVFMSVTSFLTALAIAVFAIDFIRTASYLGILGAVVLIALFICLGIWSMMYSGTIRNASVRLYGTKTNVKVQTLTDAQHTPQNNNIHLNSQPTAQIDSESQFLKPVSYKQTEVFALPKQNEPNPYGKKSVVQKEYKKSEATDENHINFSNPYKNFVPQNPFNNDKTE